MRAYVWKDHLRKGGLGGAERCRRGVVCMRGRRSASRGGGSGACQRQLELALAEAAQADQIEMLLLLLACKLVGSRGRRQGHQVLVPLLLLLLDVCARLLERRRR